MTLKKNLVTALFASLLVQSAIGGNKEEWKKRTVY